MEITKTLNHCEPTTIVVVSETGTNTHSLSISVGTPDPAGGGTVNVINTNGGAIGSVAAEDAMAFQVKPSTPGSIQVHFVSDEDPPDAVTVEITYEYV